MPTYVTLIHYTESRSPVKVRAYGGHAAVLKQSRPRSNQIAYAR